MPAAKPATLLLLNGRGDGKDSAGRPVPEPPPFNRGAPEPPEWLSAEARAEWDRVIPGLERLDLLKPEDRAVLATYCEVWSTLVDATALVRTDGILLTNPENGRRYKNPALSAAEAAAAQLRTYAALFGLSPAAERNIARVSEDTDNDENDPFATTGTG